MRFEIQYLDPFVAPMLLEKSCWILSLANFASSAVCLDSERPKNVVPVVLTISGLDIDPSWLGPLKIDKICK